MALRPDDDIRLFIENRIVLVDGMPELLPDPYAARRGAESACPRNHDGAGGPRQPRWACHPEKAMCGTADQV